jgi:boron transporter
VHTDSLTIYETRLKRVATEEGEGADIRKPIVEATAVVEQRVSHFLMGLALIGTMTGPLLKVLGTMPRAVFAGVFFIVGVSHLVCPPVHRHHQQPKLLTQIP